MSEIATAIRAAVKRMIKPDLLLGKVISFDGSNWTIDVELNEGSNVDQVTIKSVLNGEESGILIEPEVGSSVLCGITDGRIENLTVLVYSEIKNIRFVPSSKIILRNEDFGGLVKLQQLEQNLEAIKSAVDILKSAVANGLNAVGVAGAASGPTGAAAFNAAAASVNISFIDMENENVQHG